MFPPRLEEIFKSPLSRGPVPLSLVTRPTLDGGFEFRVIARTGGDVGTAVAVVSGLDMLWLEPNRHAMTDFAERTVANCADAALSAHLFHQETRLGWPARDCMHDSVDGEIQ